MGASPTKLGRTPRQLPSPWLQRRFISGFRQALAQVEVHSIYGGRWCTASDPGRFYSFRRDRVTGRHAALIWLQE